MVTNAISVLCIALCAACQSPGAARTVRPNIVLVMVDDLGPEWISCYGADDVVTAAIDALAAEGMLFTKAYSMPKCTPTRATLLTGQYPFRHGWVNHWDVPRWGAGCHFDPAHNLTFARLLRDSGYATAIAGKWQINDFRVQPDVLDEHGFDEWCMWTGYETGNPPSAERYWDPYLHTRDGSRTYAGRFGTDVFVDFITGFMREHRQEPFLVYFPMALTHGPLVHTPAEPDATGKPGRHAAMVRAMDAAVGRIVEAVDELGLRERTVVIFTTDNGTGRGITGHLGGREVKGGKGLLSERGCRVPFVVWGPGRVPGGTETDALTDFTDLLPTLCDLAGAEVPSGFPIDGRSLGRVLSGVDAHGERDWILAMGGSVARLTDEGRVVPERPWAARTIRDARFKLIAGEDRGTTHVYDLDSDPGETRNLLDSTDPDVRAARARLERVIESLPAIDAHPRYDPCPPQAWDVEPR